MRKVIVIFSLFIIAVIALSACNLPRPTPDPSSGDNAVKTAAARTVEAISTQIAVSTLPVLTDVPATQAPTEQLPSETSVPVVTQTRAPVATATPSQPTPTPIPCDRAKFVSETIPDGTTEAPSATFTKTWTLKNNGSCTWNSSYSLVFVSGDAMGAAASKPLTSGSVAPGESVQITLDLKAPSKPGTYRGTWNLRNAAGALFGLGVQGNDDFWVEIKVAGLQYNFVDNFCKAEWRNGSSVVLACPGTAGDSQGFAVKVDNPRMEDGSVEDETVLWTNPQAVNNGEISGKFPAMAVTSGSHFMSVIGCQYSATNCNVKFLLNYIADGGSVQTLASWNEVYDGKFHKVDVDLSSLAGKSVQFILTVQANGSPDGDQAFWLEPRIQ
ncbi:MAG: NBR1-Ig-like domain-containing protein [Chloroflexi bacterium]|nr:NBR1-Ig-like domain-containing protein [Chloroflexota bacterium]